MCPNRETDCCEGEKAGLKVKRGYARPHKHATHQNKAREKQSPSPRRGGAPRLRFSRKRLNVSTICCTILGQMLNTNKYICSAALALSAHVLVLWDWGTRLAVETADTETADTESQNCRRDVVSSSQLPHRHPSPVARHSPAEASRRRHCRPQPAPPLSPTIPVRQTRLRPLPRERRSRRRRRGDDVGCEE